MVEQEHTVVIVWHKDTRILDLELDGVQMIDYTHAQVDLTITWHRIRETTLRTTSIAQKWRQGDNTWLLVKEVRTTGARGLFLRTRTKKKKKKKARSLEVFGATTGQVTGPSGL